MILVLVLLKSQDHNEFGPHTTTKAGQIILRKLLLKSYSPSTPGPP